MGGGGGDEITKTERNKTNGGYSDFLQGLQLHRAGGQGRICRYGEHDGGEIPPIIPQKGKRNGAHAWKGKRTNGKRKAVLGGRGGGILRRGEDWRGCGQRKAAYFDGGLCADFPRQEILQHGGRQLWRDREPSDLAGGKLEANLSDGDGAGRRRTGIHTD